MKKLFIIILLLFSCAPLSVQRTAVLHDTTPEMKALYEPLIEVSFCLSPEGDICNIHKGSRMSAPVPMCGRGAIMMHSHLPLTGFFPSRPDYLTWKEYKKRYGNEYFGVMKENWYKVYYIK